MKRPITNLAHSIEQRLQNKAKQQNRPVNELRQYYAMERFLYRISKSPIRDRVVLKGALLLTVWQVSEIRSTKDIDLYATIPNDPQQVAQLFCDICKLEVEADGLEFHADKLTAEQQMFDVNYPGIRIRLPGNLGNARVSISIDIGFSDQPVPPPRRHEYQVILDDLPAPRLKCYELETVIAEKFEAILKRGVDNSRMKDFFDIWALSQRFKLEGSRLAVAIQKTCNHRNTSIPPVTSILPDSFADTDRQRMWQGFLRSRRLHEGAEELVPVLQEIRRFLLPVAEAIAAGHSFTKNWQPDTGWT